MSLINYLQVSVAILEVQGRFGKGHHKSQRVQLEWMVSKPGTGSNSSKRRGIYASFYNFQVIFDYV